MHPLPMAPSVAPRMQMYLQGALVFGNHIFYGQGSPGVLPQASNLPFY